ncbi:MAG: prepilin-type N-terminal cleavage/methylation domain-containing protein [Patescibacteria group bacterium]
MKQCIKKNKGFTLIEILVVIGIIAVLAAAVLIAINPARQFAQAHDSQRSTNIEAILNAVGQNIADNKGSFNCTTLPITATVMKSTGGYDIATCLEPTYISKMPTDPVTGTYTDKTNYNSNYTIMQDTNTKRITVVATPEIPGATISTTR